MATLTTTQRADMQIDLGIDDTETVFTNAELDRFYTRAESDYDTAVYYGYRGILASTAKLHDYRVATSSESLSQVHTHIKDMVKMWRELAEGEEDQVELLGMQKIPPDDKRKP